MKSYIYIFRGLTVSHIKLIFELPYMFHFFRSTVCHQPSKKHMVGYILIRVRVVGDVPHEAIEQWRGTAEFRDYAMQARST